MEDGNENEDGNPRRGETKMNIFFTILTKFFLQSASQLHVGPLTIISFQPFIQLLH